MSENRACSGAVLCEASRVPVCVFPYVCWIYTACGSPGLVRGEFVVTERGGECDTDSLFPPVCIETEHEGLDGGSG